MTPDAFNKAKMLNQGPVSIGGRPDSPTPTDVHDPRNDKIGRAFGLPSDQAGDIAGTGSGAQGGNVSGNKGGNVAARVIAAEKKTQETNVRLSRPGGVNLIRRSARSFGW